VTKPEYAITTERRMSHPATVAIGALARDKLFV
jgi:LysR family transcriptional activator of nhaA